ncbi:MAG TPA: phosphonate dehydrogenase [Candidatus Angelobacter sp.]
MSSRPKVVITHRVHESVKQFLGHKCEVVANEDVESWPPSTLLGHVRDADAVMAFMPDRIDEAFLAHCDHLKIVAAALKGYDNIDVEACTRHGVWLTIVPDLLSVPTAELALALVLGITRNIPAGDRLVRSGKFQGWRPVLYGAGLTGKTVGILGMGKLGQAFVRLLSGFNANLLYYDPVKLGPVQEGYLGLARASFEELISQSEIVVVLAPLTPATLHLINTETIARMKPGAYLVNVGRGSVVDEEAVARALKQGHLAGYAADTFEMEDQARTHPPQAIAAGLIADVDQTLFTPHLGSAVAHVRQEIELAAAKSILQALAGEAPAGAVNQPARAGVGK